MTFQEALAIHSTAYGVEWTEKQKEQLEQFYYMLVEKNKVMNLTGITEEEEFVLKHIIDSISCVDEQYFLKNASLIDVGTGAGFPGIPIAIYRPDLQITLFDSLQKRLSFLEEVIDTLGLVGVVTCHGRAEDVAHQASFREQFDIATSRAVARLPILLEYALPFIKKGGLFVALKGAAYEDEQKESNNALQKLGGELKEVREIKLPTLEDKRAVVFVRKMKITPMKYPRKPKEIKNSPL